MLSLSLKPSLSLARTRAPPTSLHSYPAQLPPSSYARVGGQGPSAIDKAPATPRYAPVSNR
jgi:hypothetical protein